MYSSKLASLLLTTRVSTPQEKPPLEKTYLRKKHTKGKNLPQEKTYLRKKILKRQKNTTKCQHLRKKHTLGKCQKCQNIKNAKNTKFKKEIVIQLIRGQSYTLESGNLISQMWYRFYVSQPNPLIFGNQGAKWVNKRNFKGFSPTVIF